MMEYWDNLAFVLHPKQDFVEALKRLTERWIHTRRPYDFRDRDHLLNLVKRFRDSRNPETDLQDLSEANHLILFLEANQQGIINSTVHHLISTIVPISNADIPSKSVAVSNPASFAVSKVVPPKPNTIASPQLVSTSIPDAAQIAAQIDEPNPPKPSHPIVVDEVPIGTAESALHPSPSLPPVPEPPASTAPPSSPSKDNSTIPPLDREQIPPTKIRKNPFAEESPPVEEQVDEEEGEDTEISKPIAKRKRGFFIIPHY